MLSSALVPLGTMMMGGPCVRGAAGAAAAPGRAARPAAGAPAGAAGLLLGRGCCWLLGGRCCWVGGAPGTGPGPAPPAGPEGCASGAEPREGKACQANLRHSSLGAAASRPGGAGRTSLPHACRWAAASVAGAAPGRAAPAPHQPPPPRPPTSRQLGCQVHGPAATAHGTQRVLRDVTVKAAGGLDERRPARARLLGLHRPLPSLRGCMCVRVTERLTPSGGSGQRGVALHRSGPGGRSDACSAEAVQLRGRRQQVRAAAAGAAPACAHLGRRPLLRLRRCRVVQRLRLHGLLQDLEHPPKVRAWRQLRPPCPAAGTQHSARGRGAGWRQAALAGWHAARTHAAWAAV
jgi:hypothetical protein